MVRLTALFVIALMTSVAFADRLIMIPTGKKILSGGLRYEILTLSGKDSTLGWVGAGIGQSYDFEITGESYDSNRVTTSLDMSYNYTVPVTDFAPGVSFGVQDVRNVTRRGRNAYLAVTYRFGNYGEHNQDVPTELTFGFWTRHKGLMFVGASLPLSEPLSLVMEHDSEQLSAGFDLSPFRGGSFRAMFRAHETVIGLRFFAAF